MITAVAPAKQLAVSPTQPAWKLAVKRVIDIVGSSIVLILLLPLYLVLALLVKCSSEGPVLYCYEVLGKDQVPFTAYKFRTMIIGADAMKNALLDRNEMTGPMFKVRDDPRITNRLGKFLRRYSLDELPQLWNVLKGDISLVGPRAPSKAEFDGFEDWQRRKLSVIPGITCLWQVNGRNTVCDFNEWAALDLAYIDNWSLTLDMKILLKTLPVVLQGSGH